MAIERIGFEIAMTADAAGVVQGAAKSAEALGNVAKETKGLNEDLDKGKDKLEGHGKNLEQGAHHAELFGEKHHEAHAAVHALGELLPGVGMLARDMWNPATFAIGIFSLGLGALIKEMEDASGTEQKMVADAAKGVGATAAEIEKAINDATEANRKFLESLAGKEMDAALAKFALVAKGYEEISKAADAAAEADIQRQMESGGMSREEGPRRIGNIRRSASARGRAESGVEIENRLELERGALASAQGKLLTDEQARQLAAELASATKRAGVGEPADLAGRIAKAAEDYGDALDAATHPRKWPAHDPAALQADVDEANRKWSDALKERDDALRLQKDAENEARRIRGQLDAHEKAKGVVGELGGENGKIALDELAAAVARGVYQATEQAPRDVGVANSLLDRGRAVIADSVNAANWKQRQPVEIAMAQMIEEFRAFISTHPNLNGDKLHDLQRELDEFREELRWLRSRDTLNRHL